MSNAIHIIATETHDTNKYHYYSCRRQNAADKLVPQPQRPAHPSEVIMLQKPL